MEIEHRVKEFLRKNSSKRMYVDSAEKQEVKELVELLKEKSYAIYNNASDESLDKLFDQVVDIMLNNPNCYPANVLRWRINSGKKKVILKRRELWKSKT